MKKEALRVGADTIVFGLLAAGMIGLGVGPEENLQKVDAALDSVNASLGMMQEDEVIQGVDSELLARLTFLSAGLTFGAFTLALSSLGPNSKKR